MKGKHLMKKKVLQLKQVITNEPKRVAVWIVGFNALSQLAFSQIHIESLVRVKLTVSTIGASNYTSGMPSIGIGMFNFMFILFGLTTIFNISRANERKKQWVAFFSILGTLLFGSIYFLKMVNPDNIINYKDVSSSINLMIVSFILYIVGAVFLIFEMIKPVKEV